MPQRDCIRVSQCPNAETVMRQLLRWIARYNTGPRLCSRFDLPVGKFGGPD